MAIPPQHHFLIRFFKFFFESSNQSAGFFLLDSDGSEQPDQRKPGQRQPGQGMPAQCQRGQTRPSQYQPCHAGWVRFSRECLPSISRVSRQRQPGQYQLCRCRMGRQIQLFQASSVSRVSASRVRAGLPSVSRDTVETTLSATSSMVASPCKTTRRTFSVISFKDL
jgi:hypothetical protein